MAFPTPLYTHPDPTYVYTGITSSGPAIYVSGFNVAQSSIQKFLLNTSGVMPTLTSAITAAEFPVGEIVYSIYYYLGLMMIGTSKGIRVAEHRGEGEADRVEQVGGRVEPPQQNSGTVRTPEP